MPCVVSHCSSASFINDPKWYHLRWRPLNCWWAQYLPFWKALNGMFFYVNRLHCIMFICSIASIFPLYFVITFANYVKLSGYTVLLNIRMVKMSEPNEPVFMVTHLCIHPIALSKLVVWTTAGTPMTRIGFRICAEPTRDGLKNSIAWVTSQTTGSTSFR